MESNHHLVNRRSGLRIIATSLTLILAALCFIQWFRFTSAYSGMIGLNSEVAHVASAKHSAIAYFVVLMGLECIATALVAGFLRMRIFESRVIAVIFRIATAAIGTVLGTCILVAAIKWIMVRIA